MERSTDSKTRGTWHETRHGIWRATTQPTAPRRPWGSVRQHARRARGALLACVAVAVGVSAAPPYAPPVSAAPPPPALTIARLQYDGGGDWYANASSLPNLLAAVRERTTLRPALTEARVRLDDDRLWDYPYLHMTGHGEVKFSPAEVARLREYLLRGGFLHADDNYGMDASFRREMARVFPDRPLVEVPRTHPIYHAVYDFPRGLPKIHEHDGKPARGFGVYVGDRLAVFYSVECDLGNGWETVGTYPNDPPALHEQALRMGVNLFVYAVTARAE